MFYLLTILMNTHIIFNVEQTENENDYSVRRQLFKLQRLRLFTLLNNLILMDND